MRIWTDRHLRRTRATAITAANLDTIAANLEPITPADLRVIALALEDREAKYPAQPAGLAAARVRAKIDRNTLR